MTTATARRPWGDLPVGVKIMTAVLVAVGVSAGATGATLYETHRVSDAGNEIYTDNVQSMVVASDLRDTFRLLRLDQNGLALLAGDKEAMAEKAQDIEDDIAALDDLLTEYSPGAASQEAVAGFTEQLATYTGIAESKMIPAALAGDIATYVALKDGEANDSYEACKALLKEMLTAEQTQAAARAAELNDTYRTAIVVSLSTLALALLAGVVLALWIARGISRPLRAVAASLGRVAEGDLTAEVIDPGTRDEVGTMARGLKASLDSMRASVAEVLEQAGRLAAASGDLNHVAGQIEKDAAGNATRSETAANAANDVALSVSTVAAASEEMTAAIADISRSAAGAVEVAQQALTTAAQTNASVAALGEASMEVGDVVKVINSIAEQTNLLALNATIEAASVRQTTTGVARTDQAAGELAGMSQDLRRIVDRFRL